MTARVQSSVKSQIAYSSIAQIGLIFIEIAVGLEVFALVHIAGNAFLRTYQLLVSPSVVSYKIREQFYNFVPRHKTIEDSLPKKIENSLYLLSLKEWNLDSFMYRYLWNPLKRFGNKLNFLTFKTLFWIFAPMYVIGIVLKLYRSSLDPILVKYLPGIFAFVGLVLVIKAFTERKSVRMSWILVILNHFWIAMAISFNENFDFIHIVLYLSGVVFFGIVGFIAILRLKRIEGKLDMNQFQGHIYEHPKIALVFLISCLGLAGFPISPTFVGEDLIFSHIHEDQIFLAFFVALSFIIDGLALIRIYARVFLGPHSKTYHQIAKRSS
jgi:formate hydrogenlyase subunit 3/multisubunit Na+/H+ antiporter MnhD subunit